MLILLFLFTACQILFYGTMTKCTLEKAYIFGLFSLCLAMELVECPHSSLISPENKKKHTFRSRMKEKKVQVLTCVLNKYDKRQEQRMKLQCNQIMHADHVLRAALSNNNTS